MNEVDLIAHVRRSMELLSGDVSGSDVSSVSMLEFELDTTPAVLYNIMEPPASAAAAAAAR